MHYFKITLILLFVAMASVWACGEQESPTIGGAEEQQEQTGDMARPQETPGMDQPQAPPGETARQQEQPGVAEQQQQDQAAVAGQQVEIAGTVERTAEGFAIRSIDETYTVEGRDLSDMVGKNVKATGALEESAGRQTISVNEIEVIE